MPDSDGELSRRALAIIAERWGERRGGCESYLACLAAHARSAGCEVEVFAGEEDGHSVWPGVTRIGAPAFPRLLRAWRLESGLKRATAARAPSAVLAAFPTDAATHYQPHHGAYPIAFEAERESLEGYLRKNLFPVGTHLNLKRRRLMRVEAEMVNGRCAKKIMVFSNRACRDLHRCYGVPREKIRVCPLGVDLECFRPRHPGEPLLRDWRESLAIPPGALLLLFVAHNFQLKGLGPALEGLKRAVSLGLEAHLMVVGRGADQSFKSLARRFGVADRVRFVGGLSPKELADLFRQSDALVHPTFYDHCSLATLESLASGCPVITTTQNGAAERMVSGREGIIIKDPRNTGALAEALAGLQDRQTIDRFRSEALKRRESLGFHAHAEAVFRWLGLRSDVCDPSGAVPAS